MCRISVRHTHTPLQEAPGKQNLCPPKAAIAASGCDEGVEMYLNDTDDWMKFSTVRKVVVKESH